MLLVLAALAASPGDALSIRVEVESHEVVLGQAFSLTVVRTWRKDLTPEDWNDQVLAPLALKLEDVARTDAGDRIEETRTYRAYAFTFEDVALAPQMQATPVDGGAPLVASADPLELHVKPSLDPKAPGEAELPREPYPAPFPWMRWIGGSLAAILVIAFAGLFMRHRARRATPPPPPPTPLEKARARLQALREMPSGSPEDSDALYVSLAAILRDYLEERFALPAPEMTTEEIADASSGIELAQPITQLLARCDRVKFASQMPSDEDRQRLLDDVEQALEACQPCRSSADATS